MMFKVGDTVECVGIDCSNDYDREMLALGKRKSPLTVGLLYEVVRVSESSGYEWVSVMGNGVHVTGTYASQFRKLCTPNNTIMSNVKTLLKKLTRQEPEKSFVKVGFLDEQENVTPSGREALEYILWDANKDELKKLADSILADSDAAASNKE